MQGGIHLAKNRTGTRKQPPPRVNVHPWGRQSLQQTHGGESVERCAHVGAIVEVPPTDEAIGERLHCIAVVALQDVHQTRSDSCNRAIRYPCTAFRCRREGLNGRAVPSGLERQNIAMSGNTDGQNVTRVRGGVSDGNGSSGTGKSGDSRFFHFGLQSDCGRYCPTWIV